VLAGAWSLDAEPADAPGGETVVVPDGAVEIVIPTAGGAVGFGADGRAGHGRAFVVGLTARPLPLDYQGCVSLIGVRLDARAALRLFGGALAASTGRAVHLDELAPSLARALAGCIDSGGSATALARVQGLVADAVRGSFAPDAGLDRALAAVLESQGRLPIATVARQAAVSPRQIDRAFARHVGLSPKLFARVLRFRRAWDARARHPAASWAAIAARCGYADQSHLVRDFREFAGVPPTEAMPEPSQA
jgi:AraC-like DNA-binding protein